MNIIQNNRRRAWTNPTSDRSTEVHLSVCPVWLTEHVRENNTCSLLYHTSLPIICACSNQMTSVKGDREVGKKGPRTRMSDPKLARENEIDRKDSNRERARKKGSRDWSNERTDQYVTVALSVHSSLWHANKLIFTSPLLSSWVLKKNKRTTRTIQPKTCMCWYRDVTCMICA